MAFIAIIPGELAGQEDEAYVAYECFMPIISFMKTSNLIPIGRLYVGKPGAAPLKVETINLKVAEIIECDANEIPAIARYVYA